MRKGGILNGLNPDCVRDSLLAIEKSVGIGPRMRIEKLKLAQLIERYPKLAEYDVSQLSYTIWLLKEGGLVEVYNPSESENLKYIKVSRLTFKGHQYLEKIRSENIWNKTKEVAKGIGSFSIDILGQVAGSILTTVTTSLIQGKP